MPAAVFACRHARVDRVCHQLDIELVDDEPSVRRAEYGPVTVIVPYVCGSGRFSRRSLSQPQSLTSMEEAAGAASGPAASVRSGAGSTRIGGFRGGGGQLGLSPAPSHLTLSPNAIVQPKCYCSAQMLLSRRNHGAACQW